MDIGKLKKNWDEFGATDPMWAILTESNKKGNQWKLEDFFKAGDYEIDGVMEYVQSLNIQLNKGTALDFGCGVGRLTQALAKYFDKVYGVDIADSMINLANTYNKHGDKCSFVLNEVDNLSIFDSNKFDFIYTNIVLQHMKPQYALKYIQEFIRLLNKDGVLIFQIPSERKRSDKFPRKIVRKLIPSSILDKLFYVRLDVQAWFSKSSPRMEMYAIQQEEIIKFLRDNGVRVMDVKDDPMNHGLWESYIYCITK